MVIKDVFWTLAFIGSIVKEFHQNTRFSENLKLQSEGPPEHQKIEESASHHVMNIAFAQLRAEDNRNDVRRRRETPQTMKIPVLWTFEKMNFWIVPLRI